MIMARRMVLFEPILNGGNSDSRKRRKGVCRTRQRWITTVKCDLNEGRNERRNASRIEVLIKRVWLSVVEWENDGS